MATMFVRHIVSDYDAFRKIYDGFADFQNSNGVTAESVYQAADNPNDLTVTHDFASIEAAQKFAATDELKTAMQSVGIIGAPDIWFTNKV